MVYYKSARSSHVSDYETLDSLVVHNGQEEKYIHQWDGQLRELGFTPEDRSLNTMWERNMRRTRLMDEEMKRYDDVSSGDELRQYPNLRAIIVRKLERKKKTDNLEATRQSLGGKHTGGKATGAIPSGVDKFGFGARWFSSWSVRTSCT